MKLIAATLLAVAANGSLIDRVYDSRIAEILRSSNMQRTNNGWLITTDYGDITLQRNPPKMIMTNDVNTIIAGRDEQGPYVNFDVQSATTANPAINTFLSKNNECPFESFQSELRLRSGPSSVQLHHKGHTNNGNFEGTVTASHSSNAIKINVKNSVDTGVCTAELTEKWNKEVTATMASNGNRYRAEVKVDSRSIFLVMAKYSGSTAELSVKFSNFKNTFTAKADTGSWTTATSYTLETSLFPGSPVTIPGPGNNAAIVAALDEDLAWAVAIYEHVIASNNKRAEGLEFMFYTDKAAQQLNKQFYLDNTINAINIRLPQVVLDKACDFDARLCGVTVKDILKRINEKVNDALVKIIKARTAEYAPAARDTVRTALDTNGNSMTNGWFAEAMRA